MKKNRYIFLSLIFLASTLCGEGEPLNININVDQDGRMHPQFSLPINWNANWYSGLGFNSKSIIDHDRVEGFDDSRVASAVNDARLRLNLVSYTDFIDKTVYSIGIHYNYFAIEKTEFGYLHMPPALGGEWVAFDNEVDLSVKQTALHADVSWVSKNSRLFCNVNASYAPASEMTVKQETRFKPIVTNTGSGTSTISQDASYKLAAQVAVKLHPYVSIGIGGEYEFLPLEYGVQILDYDSGTSTFSFVETMIESEETVVTKSAKLMIHKDVLNGMSPFLGYGEQEIISRDVSSDTTSTLTNHLTMFGFERKF